MLMLWIIFWKFIQVFQSLWHVAAYYLSRLSLMLLSVFVYGRNKLEFATWPTNSVCVGVHSFPPFMRIPSSYCTSIIIISDHHSYGLFFFIPSLPPPFSAPLFCITFTFYFLAPIVTPPTYLYIFTLPLPYACKLLLLLWFPLCSWLWSWVGLGLGLWVGL